MQYLVENYGAKGDGISNDAGAIQSAIDTCAAAGGGQVVLQGGRTYYSGSLFLKSNVDLHLERGARLKAHSDISAYYQPNGPKVIGAGSAAVLGTGAVDRPVTLKPSYAFIYAKDAECFSITGQGSIDGNVWAFMKRVSPYYCTGDYYPRPTMVYVEHCSHISFLDVTMCNSPFWTLHPAGCSDVLIRGIRILNPLDCANSDGIDPDHSTDVRILGCHISCADDCICLKTTAGNREYGPCRNIIISGCTLTSTSAAIKIGTESEGDFENVIVDNCIISDSNRGISIQLRDSGNVRNVSFSNIVIETRRFAECWWGTAEPIVITVHGRYEDTMVGKVTGIRFSNIVCDGENGVFLSGGGEDYIEDVSFEKVYVTLRKKSKWERGLYDLRPGYGKGIEREKSAGFFLRRADKVNMRDCRVRFEGTDMTDFGQAFCIRDCGEVTREEQLFTPELADDTPPETDISQ